jgi:long-chain fatty acid transport protein
MSCGGETIVGQRANKPFVEKTTVNYFLTQSLRAGLVSGLAAICAIPSAQASGFAIAELSTAGLSTANALVANPQALGAFAYNPAAMGFHDESSLALGGIFINLNLKVDTASGTHHSDAAEWVAGPIFQAAAKINDQWRIGLGATVPFGLETRWGEGTFPALSGTRVVPLPPPLGPTALPTGNQPTASEVQILDITPTATYRINDLVSVSAGVDYYWTKQATLNSSLANLDGDGSGWGWNLGVMAQKDAWTFGANFHSAATVSVDGSYTPLNQTLVMIGRLPPGQPAEPDLNLPWRLQMGVRYAINPQLAVEVDWTRTGWSKFQDITVTGRSTGQVISKDIEDWEDTNAIRLGLTYDIRPKTQLRFGYSYDQSAQPDAHFSARVPDMDHQLFSLGVAQDLGQGFSLEAGYMYVKASDRNYVGDRPYVGQADVNGTTAINGDYKADINLFAVQVNKLF